MINKERVSYPYPEFQDDTDWKIPRTVSWLKKSMPNTDSFSSTGRPNKKLLSDQII